MYTMTPYHANRMVRSLFSPLFSDDFFRPLVDLSKTVSGDSFRVDVKDGPEAYTLTAELPGVKPADISLNTENDVLTIEADLNTERKEENEHYVYTERRTGHMARSFSLEGVRQEDISAAYENGVLRVTLPKAVPEAPKGARKITISGIPAEENPAEPAADQ